jgi:hypothetical protein
MSPLGFLERFAFAGSVSLLLWWALDAPVWAFALVGLATGVFYPRPEDRQ